MTRIWRLDSANQTLIIASREDAIPFVAYWGLGLPPDEDISSIPDAVERARTGGTLDAVLPITFCPVSGDGFPGQQALVARDQSGRVLHPRFVLKHADDRSGRLAFECTDTALGLIYEAEFVASGAANTITLSASLVSEKPIAVDWFAAPVLPVPDHVQFLQDYSGRWCGEFQRQIKPIQSGLYSRESREGRTGHGGFPGCLLTPTEHLDQGTVFALNYGWSGGHRHLIEELPDGRRHIQFGHAVGSEVMAGTHFETGPLHVTVSSSGLVGCSTAYQRLTRDQIVRWPDDVWKRPLHYNCWEAVYFDHDPTVLTDLVQRAANLGVERFVLDDGWFGKRDDDTSSLGDWVVDQRKYPDGLMPLIDRVRSHGMEFGLWVEPEMVNPDSDLFRNHPDWILGPLDQTRGRSQLVLNLAIPSVEAFITDVLTNLLLDHPIAYLKWDHNRVLPHPDAEQTKALYRILDKLAETFPRVEIESCASGGGRVDTGILQRTARVWLSDSNDAIERLRMQHEAAAFLPACVTGSHVGPRECHTSGRILPISFRAWVAAQRHMGLEMDLRELTDDEARCLTKVIGWWKANRDWMMRGDILPLKTHDPSIVAELQISSARDRFVLFAGQIATSDQIAPRPIPLAGLDPDQQYALSLLNAEDLPELSRGDVALSGGEVTQSGAFLMNHGVTLPWQFPNSMLVVEGRCVR